MNNKPANRSRACVLTGGYTVLLAGFLVGGVIPRVSAMVAARDDIGNCRQQMELRANQRQLLDATLKSIELIRMETQDYERLVPPSRDFGPFLTDLYQLLSESGMRDVSVRNLPATPLGRSERLPIEVRGKGSFAAFQEFLIRLEGLPRLSSVGRLAIEADTDMSGNVEVQLTLFIYNAKASS